MPYPWLIRIAAIVSLFLGFRSVHAEPLQVLGVGSTIQDFGLRSIDPASGKLTAMHWLSDYVGDRPSKAKRVVLLSFYATWCKPCLDEMPALQRLQDTYGAQGLQVLAVNVRAKGEDALTALTLSRELIETQKVRYPVLFDRYTHRNQLLYLGDAAVLPCNVLIDQHGKIVARFQGAEAGGMEALEAAVKKQLASAVETLGASKGNTQP